MASYSGLPPPTRDPARSTTCTASTQVIDFRRNLASDTSGIRRGPPSTTLGYGGCTTNLNRGTCPRCSTDRIKVAHHPVERV